MTNYSNGAQVTCSAVFQNTAGTAIDPTSVNFQVTSPAGTVTAYTYGSDTQLVKDSTGHYHVDVSASVDGVWAYRFYSTGTGQAASEATFVVESRFV
jgi:hypothetical protein